MSESEIVTCLQPLRDDLTESDFIFATMADAVDEFAPGKFVCIGSGKPIGYPRIEFDVEPHEWEVVEPVNRDKGSPCSPSPGSLVLGRSGSLSEEPT